MNVLTASTLSTLLLEGLKWLIRTIKKDPNYNFPVKFYAALLPIINAAAFQVLYFLGLETTNPILGMTAVEIIRYVVILILSSVTSVVVYELGINPVKTYARELKGM